MRENLAYNSEPIKKDSPGETNYLEGVNDPVFDYRIGKVEQTVSDQDYAPKTEKRLTREDFEEKAIIARKIKIIPEAGDIFSQPLVSVEDMETIVVDDALVQKPAPKPLLTRADFSKEAIERLRNGGSQSELGSNYQKFDQIDPRLMVKNENKEPIEKSYFPGVAEADLDLVPIVADESFAKPKPKPLTRENFTDAGISNARIQAGAHKKTFYPPANAVPIKFSPAAIPPKKSFFGKLVPKFISKFFR